jgi:hypothetical protein
MARPSTYTEEIADKICARIASGESVLSIAKDPEMPASSTIYLLLLDEDKKLFSEKYDKARIAQADHYFDQLLEIADDGTNDTITRATGDGETYEVANTEFIQRSRLRVDTRKWYLSKIMPKKYGEKLDVTSDGESITNVNINVITKSTSQSATDEESGK